MTDGAATAIDDLPSVGAAAICMGVFDGVHRGHLALVEETVRTARERRIRSAAIVFDPHPDDVIRPATRVPRLASLAETLRLLAAAGVDLPLPVRFDAALRALTAEEFLAAMAPALQPRALVLSPESAFGRDRAGTPEAVRRLGRRAGFDVVELDGLVMDGSAPISSSRIRAALAVGDLAIANGLLGHPAYLEGTAGTDGDVGSLRFAYSPALPAPGRYRVGIRGDSPTTSIEGWMTVGAAGAVELHGASSRPPGAVAIDLLARD